LEKDGQRNIIRYAITIRNLDWNVIFIAPLLLILPFYKGKILPIPLFASPYKGENEKLQH
jgi:hypothetical protein